MKRNDFSLLAFGFLLMFVGLIGCGEPSKVSPGYPTEEQAAANRARLRNVPVQTEGLLPDQTWKSVPVEQPTETQVQTSIKIQLNMETTCHVVGEQFVKCPHCGQPIKIEVTPYFVSKP